VEFYRCSAELPPSACGNLKLDPGEQCDDGNDFIGDGCSNTCQVEPGWQCTAPKPPGEVGDPGFEAGTPNPFWAETSLLFGTALCDEATCETGTGSGPASGDWWAWFGGTAVGEPDDEEASLSQSVTIPATATELTFALEASACDSAADYLEVLIDGNQEFLVTGSDPACGTLGYATRSVDITAYADGGSHDLVFHAETFANNLDVTNFFVDDVAIPGVPSACTSQSTTQLTLNKVVVNDNGGSATVAAFGISTSAGALVFGAGNTVGSTTTYTAATLTGLDAGVPYTLVEANVAGYSEGSWSCTPNAGGGVFNNGSVTLAVGEAATCTITNNDNAPSLTLNKVVVNDNGGIAAESAWTLNAAGPTPLSGPGAAGGADVVSGPSFDVGTYTLSESAGPAGYAPSLWTCTGNGSQNSSQITLALGQNATCTITNNDVDTAEQIFADGFESN
jgi:cysteine-rich repeat protein